MMVSTAMIVGAVCFVFLGGREVRPVAADEANIPAPPRHVDRLRADPFLWNRETCQLPAHRREGWAGRASGPSRPDP